MKIIDYTVVMDNNGRSLAEKVQAHMKEGWAPLGGVSIAAAYDTAADFNQGYVEGWAQAMVRYE
jgi:hypothetical protein